MYAPELSEPAAEVQEESLISAAIDPIEIAERALAKLKAHGHIGIVNLEEPVFPNQRAAEVIVLDDYRPEPLSDTLLDEGEYEKSETEGPKLKLSEAEPKKKLEPYQEYLLVKNARVNQASFDQLFADYKSYIKYIAQNYHVQGAEWQDLVQEANIGFYRAVQDFDLQKGSFKNFVWLCVYRNIITAVKTSTRAKHAPLNSYVSFESNPVNAGNDELTIGDILPGPATDDPLERVVSAEALRSDVDFLSVALSPLESDALRLFLEEKTYVEIAGELGCDAKAVDNALQRLKRKLNNHMESWGSIEPAA